MRSGYLGRKMADDFDIIIIGAGIAGTACALRCARAGFRSCCLNAANFPAVKISPAGAVLPRARRTASSFSTIRTA
jgi:electron transfer flavoprotein-quinone oxidoreductase